MFVLKIYKFSHIELGRKYITIISRRGKKKARTLTPYHQIRTNIIAANSVCDPHINSVQFGRSVVSDSLQPHELQHTRSPCPSPTPGVHPNPRPLSRWCHPTISSSVVPFSSCPQSFPASGWVSASSVLPMNTFKMGVISPLISSSILGTNRPGEFLFQYPIILPFHTVHAVLKARILKWFAIPFSSGPYSVRPLHHDPSILGGPTWHGLVSLS